MMEKEQRIKKLKESRGRDKTPCGYKEIRYRGETKKMPVYEIPLDYLIFNQHNGRIATFVKTHEKEHGEINATTAEGEEWLDRFLWESNKGRNEKTQADLKKKGQLEYGIVTADGVVIDGNRRFMLLKRNQAADNEPTKYFKAIILEDTLEDNPKEIMRLETSYQMGVDDKVDYNPIQKYLKCRDLKREGFSEDEIADMMGEKPGKIKGYLSILELMDEYLNKNGYEGMYRVLDTQKLEPYFERLSKYLATYKEKKRNVKDIDWKKDIKDSDIDDLKHISFDYIRWGGGSFDDEEGKHIDFSHPELRKITQPKKDKGFFPNQKIWEDFSKAHFNTTDNLDTEKSLDELREAYPPDTDSLEIIRARDGAYKKKVNAAFKENFGRTSRELEDQNNQDEPLKLLQAAYKTLEKVNPDIEAFGTQEVRDEAKKIESIAYEFMKMVDDKMKKK